jgi:hypothetical protein
VAVWQGLANFVTFEPRPSKPKAFPAVTFCPDDIARAPGEFLRTISNSRKVSGIARMRPAQEKCIPEFVAGYTKLKQTPTIHPFADAAQIHQAGVIGALDTAAVFTGSTTRCRRCMAVIRSRVAPDATSSSMPPLNVADGGRAKMHRSSAEQEYGSPAPH